MSMAVLHCGDAREVLARLPAASVQCCVTSPPYWNLRNYGVLGQLGLEARPQEYIQNMVAVFQGVQRVLREDGTLWLNLGDSFHDKEMLGMPWRVAFALRESGWRIRSDIIWSKPNPMPESVTDRPTRAHEYVFLLSKWARYFYDGAAIRTEGGPWHVSKGRPEPRGWAVGSTDHTAIGHNQPGMGARKNDKQRGHSRRHEGFNDRWDQMEREQQITNGANARSVWAIATQPYPSAHFATFPEELARRCILAGSKPGDTVLDPFGGSGTVAQVATGNGRSAVYIDLNPKYLDLARQRIGPMLCEGVA